MFCDWLGFFQLATVSGKVASDIVGIDPRKEKEKNVTKRYLLIVIVSKHPVLNDDENNFWYDWLS